MSEAYDLKHAWLWLRVSEASVATNDQFEQALTTTVICKYYDWFPVLAGEFLTSEFIRFNLNQN